MNPIQLLYAGNVISRKYKSSRQQLTFFMLVDHLDNTKQVDVLWCGEDGAWQTLAAEFHSKVGPDLEYWRAQVQIRLTATQSLPGNIQFAARYRCLDQEYWDNNHGLNYVSEADSGTRLLGGRTLQNIGFNEHLPEKLKYLPITVAVDQSLAASKISVHWTRDNWRHTHRTSCFQQKTYWDKAFLSNARNPNQYGVEIWKGWLKIDEAFRLQYTIACESHGTVLWDNNYGRNYSSQRPPLKILILNLHCYQEDNQDYKFSQIARAINELKIDIVCFQEVAENWNDGQGDWNSNSAKIINDRLEKPYHIYTDWSHLGFERYREGVAILSRFPLTAQESRYVSDSVDSYSIHSRKVVMSEIHVPNIGAINVFSAHLSWWEDGFSEQFARLRDWAAARHNDHVIGTLLCGDFNIAAGSVGYDLVVTGNEYEDQFLSANAHGVFEKVFRVNDPYWQNYLSDDYRIDYIFLKKESELTVTSGRVLFTEQDYGQVSDHCGYLMTFEPKTKQS